MSRDAEMIAAVQAGDREGVAALVASDPGLAAARDENGVQAPLLARFHGRREIAELLLAADPELDVFAAAGLGRLTRLRALLDAEPALTAAFAGDGFYPLGLAAFFAQAECVALLLSRGADVEAVARNAMRVRPLHAATAGHSLACVRLLLAAGADPNTRQQQGYLPLQTAALHGDLDMVEALLAAGAEAAARSDDGKSAADLARAGSHLAVVARLERGS